MLSPLMFKFIGALVVIAALFGAYKYVGHLKNEINELQTANTVLSTTLKTQNDAIDKLKKEADERLKSHEKELEQAKKEAQEHQGKAQVIYKTKPSTPGDGCKSALDLVNGVAK